MLRKVHFEQVVEISQTFKTYSEDSFGSEAKRALDEGTRLDYPKKTTPRGKRVIHRGDSAGAGEED